MNSIIKRAAVAAALLTVVAVSGCASIESGSWGSTPPPLPKLPGDSLGYLVDRTASDVG
jgi:hypothetical protein